MCFMRQPQRTRHKVKFAVIVPSLDQLGHRTELGKFIKMIVAQVITGRAHMAADFRRPTDAPVAASSISLRSSNHTQARWANSNLISVRVCLAFQSYAFAGPEGTACAYSEAVFHGGAFTIPLCIQRSFTVFLHYLSDKIKTARQP